MKRQIGIGALAGLAMAALLLAGCDTASNSGASGDEGGTQVTPPQVNAALDGLGYVVEGKLSTPIWEFEGGKAYDTEGTEYPYTVNDSVLSITVRDTVYTYTVSADKETLTNGQKKTGDSDPVAAKPSSLVRNLAGLTYENQETVGDGSKVILTFKTRGKFYLQKDSNNVTADKKTYTVTDAGKVTIPQSNYNSSTISYTLDGDRKTLIAADENPNYFSRNLTLVTETAAE